MPLFVHACLCVLGDSIGGGTAVPSDPKTILVLILGSFIVFITSLCVVLFLYGLITSNSLLNFRVIKNTVC